MNPNKETTNLLRFFFVFFFFYVFVLSARFQLSEAAKDSSAQQVKLQNRRLGSSVVFPVSGNVYPLGYYYVLLNIGNPPKLFDLDIDTGSDLTWVQCDAPCNGCTKPRAKQYKPNHNTLPCSHLLCSGLDLPQNRPCADPQDQCDYEIGYSDHASSIGALVTDEFPLRLANGSAVNPHLTFGCGYDQQNPGPHPPPPTAGILGLGRGKISISTQLKSLGATKNVIVHCLSHNGKGFLSIGDELVPTSGVTWTSLATNSPSKNYMTGPAELLFNAKTTGVKGINFVFDSGSSYTYFNAEAYQTILDLIRKDLNGKPLKDTEDKNLPVCWKGKKPLKSLDEVKKYFKTITLRFGNQKNGQLFQVPPESYLIITEKGNICLGILNGTEVGLDSYNIIGDIFFQGIMVIYDNEQHRIGWISTDCDKIPNEYGGDISEEAYPRGFGLITELFSGSDSSKNKNLASDGEL
ncbi:PREDICTED: aspartic proteinase Asp1-like [Camelina sativa]|uniref:Aspartic proteinase Asp1-like n=1 Tax=Camelina sativa TaxID=90675 RepID=A0ABM0WJE4_CAMSA|nr:PREDICTED: aspartic proteinase Asp1-like [Camelina sativa]